MVSLTDPLRIDVPARASVRPAAPIDHPIETPTRTFHLESRGGYARSVVGTVAYLDIAAMTYMVVTAGGVLTRVPLREIHDHGARSEVQR